MILNKFGKIARDVWLKTKEIRTNVELDEFIIMPNHIHGIIIITEHLNGGGELQFAPTKTEFKSPSNTLGAIIRGYKSAVTKKINIINKTPGKPVWQRNYYERII